MPVDPESLIRISAFVGIFSTMALAEWWWP